jgi:hypothetical protein
VSKTEPFNIPEIKDQVGFRPTDRDKQNLRLVMADQRETSVSNIIRWALEEQAAPVRQRWRENAERRAKEAGDG